MQKPLVSIVCITYNHAAYIRNALDGFLMQDTSFPYEILVHDDASTDGTEAIIREYVKRFPGRISPFYETINQVSKGVNILSLLYANCHGKYYALCEGDDFWIDLNKLEIQAKYMEQHPECMMSLHNALVFDYQSNNFYLYGAGTTQDHDLTPAEIIKDGYATASMMFRPEAVFPQDSFYGSGKIGDWPLRLHVLAQGKEIHYINRTMCVYRARVPGSYTWKTYSAFMPALKHTWELIDLMKKYNVATKRRYEKFLVTRIQKSIWNLFALAGTYNIQEFDELIDHCDTDFKNKHADHYLSKLRNLFVQVYEQNPPLASIVETSIHEYRHVLIYGAGKFGKKIARQIIDAGYDYDGFIVSDGKKHLDMLMEKPIWNISALPFMQNEVLVIVAIEPRIWDELINNLDVKGFTHVISPLLYDIKQ